jgi:hypothetical protein
VVAIPQAELDRQQRDLAEARVNARQSVAKVLADPHLTDGCRARWEWFTDAIAVASAPRLAELAEQARAEPVIRRGWWRRNFGTAPEYLEWLAGDGPEEEDQEQEEEAAELAGNVVALHRGELEEISASGAVTELGGYRPCERCQARRSGPWPPATVRIDSSAPQLIPSEDLCEECRAEQEILADRMTFVRMWITARYAAPAARPPVDPWARYDQLARSQARTAEILARGQAVNPSPGRPG